MTGFAHFIFGQTTCTDTNAAALVPNLLGVLTSRIDQLAVPAATSAQDAQQDATILQKLRVRASEVNVDKLLNMAIRRLVRTAVMVDWR